MDLAGYFRRIGYTGPPEPSLATLQAIHALHPAAIPFENLDPLLGRPVPLDVAALEAKLVDAGRGGYCFEHNALFRAVLEALGFQVIPLIGRVRWMRPPDAPEGPRTHMLLRIDLPGGPYLADVGFGGYLLPAPVRLARDIEQPNAHGVVRLVGEGSLTLQAALPGGWTDCYRFTPEPAAAADYLVGNWFTSTHPDSLFRSNLLVQRLTADARCSLFNTRLTRRCRDGSVGERQLADPDDLADVLQAEFGLRLSASPAEIWARIPVTD